MRRHSMDVRDGQWKLAQTLTGQRNPAEFLRERLQDGLDAYNAADEARIEQERPTAVPIPAQATDPGYRHDYWTLTITRGTECNGCRASLAVGTVVVGQHYLYASGRRAKHYFGMQCCMKVREVWPSIMERAT